MIQTLYKQTIIKYLRFNFGDDIFYPKYPKLYNGDFH